MVNLYRYTKHDYLIAIAINLIIEQRSREVLENLQFQTREEKNFL